MRDASGNGPCRSQGWALFLIVCLLVVGPVIITKVPPTADYTNHLARNYVIGFGADDPLLSRFYTVQWKFVPNLAMDLLTPPLAHLVGIFTAGQIFIISYMLMMLTGPHVIYYALYRRLSVAPLVAALFIYNNENRDGVVNYLFGVGLSLWAVGFWIILRQHNRASRVAISLACIVVLFVCHLAAVGLYGLGVLAYEIWVLSAEKKRTGRFGDMFIADMCVFAVPFLLVPAMMALSPTSEYAFTIRWWANSKYWGILALLRAENLSLDPLVLAPLLLAAAWAWWHKYVVVHPFGWILAALSIPIYLAMPYQFLSASDLDLRLPVGMFFLWIGTLDWRLPILGWRVFVLALMAAILVRIGLVSIVWFPFNAVRNDLEKSLADVTPGSRVLIAYRHPIDLVRKGGLFSNDVFGLFYLPCLAVIERSSLVSIMHSHPVQQVIVVKPPYRQFTGGYNDDPPPISDVLGHYLPSQAPGSSGMYYRNWEHDYDYLYLIWADHEPNPAPDRLRQLYDGMNFQLYRVINGRGGDNDIPNDRVKNSG